MMIILTGGDVATLSLHQLDKEEVDRLIPGLQWKQQASNGGGEYFETGIKIGEIMIELYSKRT